MRLRPAVRSGVVAACAGFLTRPCCVLPATLSFAGVGTAGLSSLLIAHRTSLIFLSATLMSASLWIAVTREGAWLNKVLALIATVLAFSLSAGRLGVL